MGLCMTQARYVAPKSVVMVTRRTGERRFLLKPTPWMRAVFTYLLAWACSETGLKLVAAYCGSNHYHLILYDPLGRAPDFARLFNGMMTRVLNAERKQAHTSLWDNRKTHIVPIEDEEGLLDKLAYIAANPVQDGIVPRGDMWTGVRTRPMHLATTQERARPKARLFSKRSRMPKQVALEFCVPPMLAHWDRDALVAELERRIEEKEGAAREAMRKAGRSFLGLKKVRATRTSQRATKEDRPQRRTPRFIAGTAEAWRAAHNRLKRFHSLYREALGAFRQGDRAVAFPHGTYQMQHVAGVRVGLSPP